MIGRGGRDRFRRDYSPRSEDKAHHVRKNAPPSRHLWVGNLPHHISESALSEQFLRFGELDSIAFQPGRSYAFVNFRKEDDAVIAMKGLQGMPFKIEFAKAERSLTSSHDEDYMQRRDERRSAERGTQLFQRDSRTRPTSPRPSYPDKSRMGDKNAEPSEVLWIGFPAFLNVDEMVLRRAFSPFGEIEKITAFQGRSYAFVRFRSVVAACRAKEALQGKLFNNPRVSICFAKSDIGPPDQGRNSMNGPSSPRFKSSGNPGWPTEFNQDRNFVNATGETHVGSPHLASGDSSVIGFGRKGSVWTGGVGNFEPIRLHEPQAKLGIPDDIHVHQRVNPARERDPHWHDFSPGRFSRKNPFYEDPSNLSDDTFLSKKLKTGSFLPDKELPEYPFFDSGQEKQHTGLSSTFLDLPEHESYDKNFGSGPSSYKRIPDHTMNLTHTHRERDNNWKAASDRFEVGSGSLPSNPVKWQMFTPESHRSPLNEEWKWEGTIAKGGTPVCRARCLPVGKVLDIKLPEFLNCTARTGLDMLAQHFYQAASAWVVFFVPESDADISFYNEFMHYLGEKQRAAVAKLGEKTTLFLVPPSDFSVKVLKVPGKMSISGVILRFQHPSSDFGSLHHPLETLDSKLPSFHEDISYPKPTSPDLRSSAWGQSQSYINSSEPFPSLTSYPTSSKPGREDLLYMGNMPGSSSVSSFSGSIHSTGRIRESLNEIVNESRYYQPAQHQNPTLPSNLYPHKLQNSNPGPGNLLSQASNNVAAHSSGDTITKDHFLRPMLMQETSSSHYTPGIVGIPLSGSSKFSHQETKPHISSSLAVLPSLQSEQLAHLASLLGQQQQSGSGPVVSLEEDHKQSSLVNQSEHTYLSSQKPSQNHASSVTSTSQFGQVQQFIQQTSNTHMGPQTSRTEPQTEARESQGNQSVQDTGSREETDTDPQKRLQATLQLAAALLQQIQQQAKTVDQR